MFLKFLQIIHKMISMSNLFNLNLLVNTNFLLQLIKMNVRSPFIQYLLHIVR